ncbi:sensor histidine kinase [Lutimonas zeaxanthinifaciens]|uniref:sensor histidine kinase n=1 Tax=Lutimonas zeaxanthinifaciens TaxID=3060215 RepID=UPI00265CBF08|nr:histidine kinase [Lutimonas sp. YSD2104]WKK65863.1 histidine kinase [Lutimonas sp. YSD2104]
MKDKIVQFISNPLIISLVLSLLIILSLPDYFNRYQSEHIKTSRTSRKNKTYFKDLNNDGQSERIMYYENNLGNASFEIHAADEGLIDQWNFNGQLCSQNLDLWFFDSNQNGFNEIFHFSKRNDSIFLNSIEPFSDENYENHEVFVEKLEDTGKKMFFSTSTYGILNSGNNKSGELFFALNRGFSGNPRNVYKYNFKTNLVSKSPHLTNQSRINLMIDLDKNGSEEILLANYAAGNKIDSSITKRSDYNAWFMVLDENLRFKFEPIEIPCTFSSIHSFPLKNDNNEIDILCRVNSKKYTEYKSRLMLFTSEGEFLREMLLGPGNYFINSRNNFQEFILHNFSSGLIQILNKDFQELFSLTIEPDSYLFPLDLDENGKNEWIQVHNDNKSITVFEEDFKESLTLIIPGEGFNNIRPFIKKSGEGINDLFFRDGNNYYLFSYQENPFYILKYFTYVLIFLLVLSLVWFIRKGQQLKMEKQRAIENEISALQIKNINNQIDPHFVFNAINTISEMTLMDNKIEADSFITKFSNFMRGTLQKSDKITTTLSEELSYVENFIQLQQERFKNKFNYSIEVGSDVDTSFKVPKHIIFCYAENAIKHGLSGLKEKGLLKINVSMINKKMVIIIEDNGEGINEKTKIRKDSTGNGLKIMEQLFELFHKLYGKNIEQKFIELFDEKNNKSGIRVKIIISI